MTKQTLYSLRTDGDEYRITKFVDGEVESSYLTSIMECTCPAGHRPSCRHRQMLPMMLASGIVNTHWFWDFDLGRVVDFDGTLKSNLDALNELAMPLEIKVTDGGDPMHLFGKGGVVTEYHNHVEPAGPQDTTMTAECPPGCCEPFPIKRSSWRRL